MSEEEIKERLNYFKTISILYGNTFAMSIEVLKQLQKDIETVLQLLEQKDKRIDNYIEERNRLKNKMIGDKMEQFDDYIIYLIESYLKILEE